MDRGLRPILGPPDEHVVHDAAARTHERRNQWRRALPGPGRDPCSAQHAARQRELEVVLVLRLDLWGRSLHLDVSYVSLPRGPMMARALGRVQKP